MTRGNLIHKKDCHSFTSPFEGTRPKESMILLSKPIIIISYKCIIEDMFYKVFIGGIIPVYTRCKSMPTKEILNTGDIPRGYLRPYRG